MGRVFVHIGRNKTGTTAIQYALSDGREALARDGFLYPYNRHDHAFIAYSLNPQIRKDLPSAQQELMLKLADSLRNDLPTFVADVVLSCEGLQNIAPATLSEWLGDLDVWIVVYIREQAEYLASSYQQEVKARTETSLFPEFARRFNPNYSLFLNGWAAVFGADQMIVRVYDKGHLVGGDVVMDFLSILSIPDPSRFRSNRPNANPSITGALLEAKRRINGLGFAERELLVGTYQVLLDLANENSSYRGLVGADPAVVREIRERCRASNADIAQRYFGRSELFPLRPFPPDVPPTENEIQNAIDTIVSRTHARNPEFADRLSARLASATSAAV